MLCPACTNLLTEKTVSGVTLDTCENGCGGIWFDQFEFRKFDEAKEPDAETLLSLKIRPGITVSDARHDCPKCQGIKMMRHFSSTQKKVTMDECPNCAGVWLDAGELTQIRNEFSSNQDREAAAEKVFDQMFTKEMAAQKQQSEMKTNQAQSFARALRFVCPSYYIKGKQDGGAF